MAGVYLTGRRPGRLAIALSLGTLAFPSIGCEPLCSGPSCADAWPTGRLAIHLGDGASGERAVWSDADRLWEGAEAHGAGWSVDAFGSDVVVGMPEDERIVLLDGLDATTSIELAAREVWTGGGTGLGGTVAIVDDGNGWDLWAGGPDDDNDRGSVFRYVDAGRVGGAATEAAELRIDGWSPADRLGDVVRACGDLSGDGLPDVAIGMPGLSEPADGALAGAGIPSLAGGVLLVRSEVAATHAGRVEPTAVGPVWWGSHAAAAGTAIACDADVTGDGIADLLVGAPLVGEDDNGVVYVIEGGAPPGDGPLDDVASRVIVAPDVDAWAGAALAVGRFDDDDLADIAVGAPGYNLGRGAVWLWYGGDLAADPSAPPGALFAAPADRDPGDHVGRSVLVADLDGDGQDDLVVGAPDWRDVGYDTGRVGVWFGAGSVSWRATGEELSIHEDVAILGGKPFQRVGLAMAAEDVDGDGRADLLLPTRGPP